MKRIKTLICLTLLPLGVALAQGISANDVIAKIEAAQKNVKDFRMRVQGDLTNTDDRKTQIDLEVQSIPAMDLTRIKFNKPDELADNFIIIDKDKISNYLFLTNQVTVQSRKKTTSVGGFEANLDQFSNAAELFPKDKVNFKPVVEDDTSDGKAWVLEATPKANSDLDFGAAKAWVSQKDLRVLRLQYFNNKKVLQGDIKISKYETNIGLKPANLRAVPKDAEIIKK